MVLNTISAVYGDSDVFRLELRQLYKYEVVRCDIYNISPAHSL